MAVDKNPLKIAKMFDKLSKNYDFLNNIISLFTHILIKQRALKLLKIKSKCKVLDLCCGSGDLGNILFKQNKDIEIIGVDFSSEMLKIAETKNPKIKYYKMNALDLKFKDEEFDFVVIGFGLRNIQDTRKALSEIYRVLKKQGIFLQLDFGKQNLISKIWDKVVLFFIFIFLKNSKKYKYLIKSKKEFLEPEKLSKEYRESGFRKIFIKYFLFETISAQVLEK